MGVASMAMLRLMLLALVGAWVASVLRLARLWRVPAFASRYDRRFAA